MTASDDAPLSPRPHRYIDPDDETPDDPSAAAERTTLAWGRSTLSLFACGAAVARGIPRLGQSARPVVGAAMLILGGLIWMSGLPLARARRLGPELRRPARFGELSPLAYGSAVVGLAAFVLALFFPQ